MTHSFSHLGICVSDLERSVRFYCEGLGFEPVATHQVGAEFGRPDGGAEGSTWSHACCRVTV